MLTSQEFAVSFSAFRKLQILIDQVEEKAKAAGFKTRRTKSQIQMVLILFFHLREMRLALAWVVG